MSSSGRVDVLTLGEPMVSLRWAGSLAFGGTAQTSIAGAESNVAICLARLGHSVALVGRVGADDPGELVLRTLRAERVDTAHVVQDPDAATGLVLFSRPVSGAVSVTYHRSGSAGSRLDVEDLQAALRRPFRALHVSGVTCAISSSAAAATAYAMRRAKDDDALVSLDVNHRARLWDASTAAATLAPLLSSCDVLVGSAGELAMVAGLPPRTGPDDVAGHLLQRGVGQVVTKLGADGARADTGEESLTRPAHAVVEVDPVGAGDAFTAGYLSALLDGLDLAGRLKRGNQVGALVVAREGDWEGAPRRRDLESLTAEDKVRR